MKQHRSLGQKSAAAFSASDRTYNQGMRWFRIISAGILFAVCQLCFQAQKVKWIEVTSENFRLFTDTSEMKGRRLVSDLEQRVGVFQALFGAVPKRQFPIEPLSLVRLTRKNPL